MFCGKCGTKLNEDAKFCGKCGTKVNTNVNNANINNTSVNNLNSFIGNIVKKNDCNAVDKDIFLQLEEDKEANPIKKSKKRTVKSKIKSKSKNKNVKSKPKKIKKVAAKKVRKKLNIKVLISTIVVALIVVAVIALFIFNKYGDDLFANNYVKKSISNTFNKMDKYNQKTNSIPNLLLREDKDNHLAEREIYLEVMN